MENVKPGLHRKLSFQPNLGIQRLKLTFGCKEIFKNYFSDKIHRD